MNKASGMVERTKIVLVIGLFVVLTGCVGFGGRGYYYEEEVVVPGPDLYLFGGDYYGGRDAHNYSHRGHESRTVAHSGRGQSRAAARSSGGQRGRR